MITLKGHMISHVTQTARNCCYSPQAAPAAPPLPASIESHWTHMTWCTSSAKINLIKQMFLGANPCPPDGLVLRLAVTWEELRLKGRRESLRQNHRVVQLTGEAG